MKNSFNRRDFLKTVGLAATSQIMPKMSFAGEARPKHPNILIIHVDEHRIDCLGAYGNADIKTPHIDRLAADGVRYDNSFCPFPVCTPSRYSFLCGQYVHEHRGWTNRDTLAPDIETFPKILRAAGYRTKAVGKMHFAPTYLDVGFSELVLAEQDGPGRWDDDYHRYLMRHGLVDRNDLEDQLVREYRGYAPKEYWDTCGALVSNLQTSPPI
jgi:arylsulfatase A-like enzyme